MVTISSNSAVDVEGEIARPRNHCLKMLVGPEVEYTEVH